VASAALSPALDLRPEDGGELPVRRHIGIMINRHHPTELAEQLEKASTQASASPDYTGYAMDQQAMRTYPGQADFASWLCEQHPWGGVDRVRPMPGGRTGEHHTGSRAGPAEVTYPAWTITRSQPDEP
jgi:hypothetical protein